MYGLKIFALIEKPVADLLNKKPAEAGFLRST
jgi:hypothetical protein